MVTGFGFTFSVDLSGLSKFEEGHRKKQVQQLKKIGAFLRRTAMFSMRRRKTASKPGTPPSVHEGGLKRLQRFVVDERSMSVDNGPILYKRGIARILEHGGKTEITVGKNKGQMMTVEPRPTMKLAQQNNLPKIAKIIGET
jgi:hypothetical protein